MSSNNGATEVLKQGDTYEEYGNNKEDNDFKKTKVEHKQLDKRIVLAIVAVGLVAVAAVLVLMFKNFSTKGDVTTTLDKESETKTEYVDEPFEDVELLEPGTQSSDYVVDYGYDPDSVGWFSNDDLITLRENGYTGWEIEEFAKLKRSTQELVAEAEALRQEKYDSEILPLFDNASPAYKELQSTTWLGLPELDYKTEEIGLTTYQSVENLDYEKIDARGHQTFIKVYLDDERTDYAFMQVDPFRYKELKEKGNIVVEILYYTTERDVKLILNMQERVIR